MDLFTYDFGYAWPAAFGALLFIGWRRKWRGWVLAMWGLVSALSELNRTLRPGGDLLVVTVNVDIYLRVAYPMAAGHSYFGQKRDPRLISAVPVRR